MGQEHFIAQFPMSLPRMAKTSLQRAASTTHLVLDSLPGVGDDGETQALQTCEMEHLAKEFAEIDSVEIPEAPLVS